MGKAEENKLQKRASLLDTSYRLFTTKGFSNTSISDIAQTAGVGKGTFYLYFKDKYDLQEKLIVHEAERLFAHAIEHSGYETQDSFASKLIVIIDDILDQMAAEPILVRFLNKELSWSAFHRNIERHKARDQVNFISLLQDQLQQEPVEWIEPKIMIYDIICLVSNASHGIILEEDPVNLAAYKPVLHSTIRAIVAAHQKAK